MRVLVTGAAGLLGAYVMRRFGGAHEVYGLDRNPWWGASTPRWFRGELEDLEARAGAIRGIRPEVVVHCAAMVNVDACEKTPERANAVNAGLVRSLVSEIAPECLFVQISTDAVFDGKTSFRREDEAPDPPNIYGQSKLAGEREAVRHPQHLIVRTNIYGWSSGRKKTSAEWMFGVLLQQESAAFYEDYFFTPMYAADLADALAVLVERGARGLLHVAGGERVSKYEFGATMARLMGVPMDRVRKGSLREGDLAATRASDVSLDCHRAVALIGTPPPSCESGLLRFLNERPDCRSGL